MSIRLKVQPQVLKAKSLSISDDIKELSRNWNEIKNTIASTKKYWEGDGSNTHQKIYKSVGDDVDIILKRLKEHPVDLQKMAGVYVATENDVNNKATGLPDDIIK